MTGRAKAWLAELVGTFGFITIVVGSVIVAGQTLGGYGLLGIATAHGVGLAAMASAFGGTSGAHFNPAVTLSAWLGRKIQTIDAIGYVVLQVGGALGAGLFLRMIFTETQWRPTNLGTPALSVSVGKGLLAEAVFTFLFFIVIWGTGLDDRGPKVGGLAIGFALFGALLIDWPITGAGLNPARYLGSAVVSGHYEHWWVYIAGPAIGAVVASGYSYLFMGTKLPGATKDTPVIVEEPPPAPPAPRKKPAARKTTRRR